MDLGRIIQVGTPQELYNRPIDVFVARLLGPTNLLQGPGREPGGRPAGRGRGANPAGPADRPDDPGPREPRERRSRSRSGPRPCRWDRRSPPGWNRFPATIERITFRGELRQIQARGPGDWPIAVSAIQSQSQNLREGQSPHPIGRARARRRPAGKVRGRQARLTLPHMRAI